ncbi:tellurite resistance methyltransferase TehB [Orrella sp. 11846]|uniref:tellurite resistance methyltransferase TehB n=1 Tax=Orrella sp. 11846 TaxID=3409913 RepID=UPI003B5C9CA7
MSFEDLSARYGMSAAHSEVVQACELVKPCKTLDMGCSNGRNALYMAQRGFEVTGVDRNAQAIEMLRQIAVQEGFEDLQALVYDINEANLGDDFDLIVCTVTLMFLEPSNVSAVLQDMQAKTRPGGYNLIVCAMDTAENPCPMGFPFTLGSGELKEAYEGWEFIKYNEDLGTMHNGARLQFATMLARKPE